MEIYIDFDFGRFNKIIQIRNNSPTKCGGSLKQQTDFSLWQSHLAGWKSQLSPIDSALVSYQNNVFLQGA